MFTSEFHLDYSLSENGLTLPKCKANLGDSLLTLFKPAGSYARLAPAFTMLHANAGYGGAHLL